MGDTKQKHYKIQNRTLKVIKMKILHVQPTMQHPVHQMMKTRNIHIGSSLLRYMLLLIVFYYITLHNYETTRTER